MTKLRLSVKSDAVYRLSASSPKYQLSAIQAQLVYTGGEKYDGEYQVTPKFTEEILETKDKLMKENVTISPIGVARVSNPSGGTTVYIGG